MDVWGEREREKAGNQGITFWVESRGFWSTYFLSVSSFPESPNLASGRVLSIMA